MNELFLENYTIVSAVIISLLGMGFTLYLLFRSYLFLLDQIAKILKVNQEFFEFLVYKHKQKVFTPKIKQEGE